MDGFALNWPLWEGHAAPGRLPGSVPVSSRMLKRHGLPVELRQFSLVCKSEASFADSSFLSAGPFVPVRPFPLLC